MTNTKLKVCVNGKPVRTYSKDGRTYIEGREETEYTIKVSNPHPYKVVAVVSVDGINTINGDPASEDGQGWVIDAYSNVNVKGFQKDDDSAGAFKFSKPKESYAKEVGTDKTSLGCIGVVMFKEKEKLISYVRGVEPEPYRGSSIKWGNDGVSSKTASINYSYATTDFLEMNMNASTESASPEANLGTTWGTEISNPVEDVVFVRGSKIGSDTVYYASKKALKKAGIQMKKPKDKVTMPDPFPKKYAKPPKGWA